MSFVGFTSKKELALKQHGGIEAANTTNMLLHDCAYHNQTFSNDYGESVRTE